VDTVNSSASASGSATERPVSDPLSVTDPTGVNRGFSSF